jgi:hypothetical protein
MTVKPSAGLVLLLITLCLSGCSPKYNWREVRGKDAHFVVLLPDKPVTVSRDINLDGTRVTMTMTAAEVDGINFAVGYVLAADPSRVPALLNAMQTALVANIHGSIKPSAPSAGIVEALGHRDGSAEPLLLLGHFEAKDNRIYQVIVLGNEKAVSREEATSFFNSFKPD